jgi:hypothetical protein
MLRRNKLRIGIGVSVLLACQVQAASMYGTLTGNSKVFWNTAEPAATAAVGDVTPSYWDVVMPRATSEWYPGSLWDASLASSVTFTDKESGESFDATIDWRGVQYNMGSAATSFSDHNYAGSGHVGGTGGVASCSGGTVGAISTMLQAGGECVSDKGFSTTVGQVTPFQFIRPIVSLPDLKTKIQGLPSGRYTAMTSYQPVYFYKSGSGALTYTLQSKPLSITVDYTAAYFVNARIVNGEDGVITPVYDKDKNRVTGRHLYTVDVQGLFPDGVKMTFDEAAGYVMNLTTKASAASKPLPYSIDCPVGCKGRRSIVKDGVLVGDNEVVTTFTTNTEGHVRFNLATSYDASGDDVDSGTYEGSFNVTFEANL